MAEPALEPIYLVVVDGEVYFNGADQNGIQDGLWRSNGTALGTVEIGGLNDAAVKGVFAEGNAPGLAPTSLTALDSNLVFTGLDSSDSEGLWISNGTTTGTVEIGGVNDAGITGAGVTGLDATNLTAFDGKVYFNGGDADSSHGLWLSDGTKGGTAEVGGLEDKGVADAASTGLAPDDITAFGSELLFRGQDSSDGFDLWISNGTPSGTTPVGGPDNALVKDAWADGLGPRDMVVLGDKVFFEGQDSTAALGLWVSDGTAGGTTEIGGLKDEGVTGSPGSKAQGLGPGALVAFNSEILFGGQDADLGFGLWVTNGTQTGTTEVGGLKNAQVKGASSIGVDPASPIAFDGEVFFSGKDADNDFTLWETNGTVAGTIEIGGLANAQVAGASAKGLNPSNFAIDGSQLLFDAKDANGDFGLWTTNGTAAGTHEIAGVSVAGVTVGLAHDDFEADNRSDVLIENTSGAVVVGQIKGASLAYLQVSALPTTAKFGGTGDFFGDGGKDFLAELNNGALLVGEVSQGKTTYITVGGLGSTWKLVGAGAFFGTSEDQFLIENTAGVVVAGNVHAGAAQYTAVATLGSEWSFKGAGDLLGDGRTGFLMEDTAGAVVVGETGAPNQPTYTQIAALGSEWKFEGVGNFLGDEQAQFLIENTAGAVVVGEYLNGKIHYTDVATLGSEWSFVAAGDFEGTTTAGFMIENTAGVLALGTIAEGKATFTEVGSLGHEWLFH